MLKTDGFPQNIVDQEREAAERKRRQQTLARSEKWLSAAPKNRGSINVESDPAESFVGTGHAVQDTLRHIMSAVNALLAYSLNGGVIGQEDIDCLKQHVDDVKDAAIDADWELVQQYDGGLSVALRDLYAVSVGREPQDHRTERVTLITPELGYSSGESLSGDALALHGGALTLPPATLKLGDLPEEDGMESVDFEVAQRPELDEVHVWLRKENVEIGEGFDAEQFERVAIIRGAATLDAAGWLVTDDGDSPWQNFGDERVEVLDVASRGFQENDVLEAGGRFFQITGSGFHELQPLVKNSMTV